MAAVHYVGEIAKDGDGQMHLSPSSHLTTSEISNQNHWCEIKALHRTISNLRTQVNALQAHTDELEAYAHIVAHNLKNPLSTIIMTADAISSVRDLTLSELQEFMTQIQVTAYEMDDLIDQLMLLAEVEKSEVPLEPVDMTGIVSGLLRRMHPIIKESRGRVLAPRSWPEAIGYGPWIEEVWANYLSNALKYGGQPPIVEMGASIQSTGMVRFWVQDNGAGIPAEAQKRLFNPFIQLGKRHKPGHGLGLSIVRSIIEKLGGNVGIESAPGHGSLFFFTLPADPILTEIAQPKDRMKSEVHDQMALMQA